MLGSEKLTKTMVLNFGKDKKMAKELKFSVVLKELPVKLTGSDGVEKKYKLKELTATQRSTYNDNFGFKLEMVDGKAKATAGEDFKLPSAKAFIALCLYDDKDKLVSEEVIGNFPSTVVEELSAAAMELSGMDEKALEKAKNALEVKDTSGKG